MAFLGTRIPIETARLIREIGVPGIKEDSAKLHITLLYLGQDVPIKTLAKAMVASFAVTQKTEPFWAKLSSVNYFDVPAGEKYPIIAPVVSPPLMELNAALKKSFNKSKVEYNKQFKEYHPHVTLSFNDEPINKTKIEPIEWIIQELVLWGGHDGDNKIFITFPLELPKNGELECERKEK